MPVHTCDNCKKEFTGKRKKKRNNKFYCSIKCSRKGNSSGNKPTKSELERLVLSGMTFLALGKKYKVSDNAVRKWCRSYGIEIPKVKHESFECICSNCSKKFIAQHNRKVRSDFLYCSPHCQKENQRKKGKLSNLSQEMYFELKRQGNSVRSIARRYGVNHTTLIRKYKKNRTL